mgnify:CR=1 FL=1
MEWMEILQSPILKHENNFVSWEEYIRMMVSNEGLSSDGEILPIVAFDDKYHLKPLVVGFVFLPAPILSLDVIDASIPIFFDHDNAIYFEEYVDYVYEFEEPETWDTDAELLLYHNRAAVMDVYLQEAVAEFGIKEVLFAALRGQYNGHNSWASHPEDVEV